MVGGARGETEEKCGISAPSTRFHLPSPGDQTNRPTNPLRNLLWKERRSGVSVRGVEGGGGKWKVVELEGRGGKKEE